jgi:type I restriction enzyme M protein
MITKDNIKKLLSVLHFEQEDDVFTKSYESVGLPLKVDVRNEHFHYKEIGITVGRETTSNFSEPENFVVFECIDRLLSMGYKPEHIELEPAWKLGHTQKGGYADIWVRTHSSLSGEMAADKESLLIIECKKSDEFDGAWRDTLEDGAQLFSYFQQEQATKFLCLYTSDFDGEKIKPTYYLINVQDNEELLKNNLQLSTYKDAKNNKQLFRVWHDTYQCDAATRGLFEDDIQPYHIGKNKFSVKDLVPINNDEIKKKYNEFATILRRHNVGAKENAFDKLVNLFLAKVVDETNNPDDLHFYWKGAAYDDDFSLQDRLQRLYRDGMEKFLNETVTYIENEQIEKAFRWYKKDPDATMKTVMEYFRALKFYSDNDFSFISVHNERLFKENAKILREVLLMLQNIRLKSAAEEGRNTETNQFLGDLFEGFLTKGVKQSEGQYFTPMPIVRFIVSSLPLEQIVSQSEGIPSCIDYACGAGHFLTEYAVRIKEFVERYRPDIDIREYYKHITGIEKEYRLSKVSKVSAFMYGHDETNIIYADSLQPNVALQPNSYDVLVANPPYAVTGFLETLSDNDRAAFSLFNNNINTAKNNAIETFFMERSAWLMHAGGVAGIVLPVSVLNKGGIYARAREIILENFDIVSLAEFGSGTFGKTGTNTVVLFLRRKETNTPAAEHYRNRVKIWFAASDHAEDIYQDECLLQAYCDHCGYELEDYRTFLKEGIIHKALSETEVFTAYRESFDSTDRNAMKGVCDVARDIRNRFRTRSKTQTFRRQTEAQKKAEKEKALLNFIISIEREKVYIFLLAFTVDTPVLIVKSPTTTAAIKKFLGYEWSDSKGNEGIEYLHLSKSKSENEDEGDDDDTVQQIRGINGIRTPLFNPDDLCDPAKINTLIRQNFLGEDVVVPEDLSEIVSQARLVDMIDFKRTAFDKAIKTSGNLREPIKEFAVDLNYKPIKIVAPIILDRIDFSEIVSSEYITTDNMLQDFGGVEPYTGNSIQGNVVYYQVGDILMSNIRPYLKKIWISNRNGGCSSDVIVFRPTKGVSPSYIGCLLQRQKFIDFVMADIKGLKMPRGNKSNIERYLVPIPSQEIQQTIVAECEAVDKEVEEAKGQIAKAKEQIEHILSEVNDGIKPLRAIAPFATNRIDFDKISASDYITTDNMLQDFEGVRPYDGEPLAGSVIEYKRGDILMSNIRPYLKKIWLADRDGGCSPDVMVFRPTAEVMSEFVYYMIRRQTFIDYVMNDVKGMKMPRGNKDNIIRYAIPVPQPEIQQQIVARIHIHEAKIAEAKAVIDGSAERKQAILDKYLKNTI